MNAPIALSQKQLSEFLLNVAVVRPEFVWGPPGIDLLERSETFPKDGPILIITGIAIISAPAETMPFCCQKEDRFPSRRQEKCSA